MKRSILLGMIIAFFPFIALAGTADCGVGTEITKGDKTIMSQTFAYTINAVSSDMTSVTFQTSGCNYSGIVQKERLQEFYVTQNYINLEEDAARGAGPYLQGLAELMDCVPEAHPAFAKLLQTDFEQLFETDIQNREQRITFLVKIKQRIKDNSELSTLCKVS